MGVNVAAVADAALRRAVDEARQQKWLEDKAATLAEQADCYARSGHPLAEIMAAQGDDISRAVEVLMESV